MSSSSSSSSASSTPRRFRINARSVFLTYPQCDASPEDVLQKITAWGKSRKLKFAIVGAEEHKDGTPHLHAVLVFSARINVRRAAIFDAFTGKHGHYEATRSVAMCTRYCTKDGNYRLYGITEDELQALLNKGQRNKSDIVATRLMKGESLVALRKEFPGFFLMHGGKIERFASSLLAEQMEFKRAPLLKERLPLVILNLFHRLRNSPFPVPPVVFEDLSILKNSVMATPCLILLVLLRTCVQPTEYAYASHLCRVFHIVDLPPMMMACLCRLFLKIPRNVRMLILILAWIALIDVCCQNQGAPVGFLHLYLHGPSGIGKSTLYAHISSCVSSYLVPNDESFYDFYQDSYDLVCFDEFCGNKTIGWMNMFLDGHGHTLRKKGQQGFRSKRQPVLCISNFALRDVYSQAKEVQMLSIQRRFIHVNCEAGLFDLVSVLQ